MFYRFSFFLVLLGIILFPSLLFANTALPKIHDAKISDSNYLQLTFDIQNNYKYHQQGKKPTRLHLYKYTVKPGETFYKIVALFNTNNITLATLNQLSSPDELKAGMEILVTNRKGIFINKTKPKSFLALFMKHSRIEAGIDYPTLTINNEEWIFLENENFSASEYAFFLKILYQFPLSEGILTSNYGPRKDPIHHGDSWHKGVDLAAPLNSEVYAANSGTVTDSGYSDIYGNYILVKHTNGYQTFYGHLNAILVTRFSKVHTGQVIGKVGSTGRSTGSHLHFEVRKDGENIDPNKLIQLNF